MILGAITVPQKIIVGAFLIRFTFQRTIDFSIADVEIETVEGDALGHDKDIFGGDGKNYHILCYLPDMRAGKSRIGVRKAGVSVESVIVEYDTVNRVTAKWGVETRRGNQVQIPLTLDAPVRILKKRNFQVVPSIPYQIYGGGQDYFLAFSELPEKVVIQGTVVKENGIDAVVEASVWEVARGTIH